MKIQYLSDLHFEHLSNRKWLKENPIIPEGDILLAAGDIYHLGEKYKDAWIFDELSEKFDQVFLIPGNHEYYGGFNVAQTKDTFQLEVRKNVTLFHNQAFEFNGVYFILSTLWSKVEAYPKVVFKWMPDFRKIKYKGEGLTIEHYNQLFENSFNFLQSAIKEKGTAPCVVMTHHLPATECTAEEFKGSPINEAFCSDLANWIEMQPIDVWIYGHSHRNLDDFEIGSTRLLTNQMGYVGNGEHHSFRRDVIFTL